jgi:hypothetical protein
MPQGSNSVTSLAQFNRELINMILPRQGAVNGDTQKLSDSIVNNIPYILESNPHPFYSCRGLKGQMRIRIDCGLDSRSRARVWPNDGTSVRAVRTVQGGKNEVRIRFENIRYLFL